jgi:hypothetical protein
VAVGGSGVGGAAVGGTVAVSVGGTGVSEGAGSVRVGGGVSLGGGLGLGATLVGVKLGEGVAVELGCGVGAGMSVFVGSRTATRVLVGVGVTAGAPGLQRTSSKPTDASPSNVNQNQRALFISNGTKIGGQAGSSGRR